MIALNPNHAPAYQSMGNNYYNLGRYEEALSSYKRAMQLDPGMRDAVLMRSTCEIYTGNAEAAIPYLEGLLKKDAGFTPAMAALAAAYFCLGQKDKGMEQAKKLKEMNFAVSQYFSTMHKILIAVQQHAYAASLQQSVSEII